jgi:hypothetical protein
MSPSENSTHVLCPARGGAPGVVLVFSAGLCASGPGGFMGLPLGILLISRYFKYIYFLFDMVVRGYGEALDLVEQRLKVIPDFRPATAAATLQIAQIAARGRRPFDCPCVARRFSRSLCRRSQRRCCQGAGPRAGGMREVASAPRGVDMSVVAVR